MKRIIFLKCFAILAVLFFVVNSNPINAFDFQEVCQPVFRWFSNGNSVDGYQAIDIKFPPLR
jgi:hypothetical protein